MGFFRPNFSIASLSQAHFFSFFVRAIFACFFISEPAAAHLAAELAGHSRRCRMKMETSNGAILCLIRMLFFPAADHRGIRIK